MYTINRGAQLAVVSFTSAIIMASALLANDTTNALLTGENTQYLGENTVIDLDLGLGNKSWSYVEAKFVTPVLETERSTLSFGANLMAHLEKENSESNEKSFGFIYRQKLSLGSDEFWGINASYSEYVTWDGNDRQTPHLGIEYYGNKFSFVANYMFQDKTQHHADNLYKPHSYYGNVRAFGEYFSGGWEVLGRYHINDNFRVGLGHYDRFGDEQKTYNITHPTYDGLTDSEFVSTHNPENLYLLQRGFIAEMDYSVGNSKWALQLKEDNHNGFLAMATFTYQFGGPRKEPNNLVKRAYRGPVYKADPDDFGIIVGLVASAIAETVVEAATAAELVEAGSLAAEGLSQAVEAGAEACLDFCSNAVLGFSL